MASTRGPARGETVGCVGCVCRMAGRVLDSEGLFQVTLRLRTGWAGADMKLANDAPIVAVPMCVKHLDGQNFHTVGEKYLTGLINGAGVYPLSFPALGPVLEPAALLDQVDGVLFT